MNTDRIDYKTLRRIQEMEKISPSLTKIEKKFYSNISEYLENLNDRLEKESSNQKKMLLKDEIKNTNKIITSIYEKREKKIVLATISKARGGNPNLRNLVDLEKDMFESILKSMIQSRKQILDNELKKHTRIEKNVESKKEDEKKEIQENFKPIVRVVKDMPKFIGTDTNEYNLKKSDVLSLPDDMKNMLSKRGVIKEIK